MGKLFNVDLVWHGVGGIHVHTVCIPQYIQCERVVWCSVLVSGDERCICKHLSKNSCIMRITRQMIDAVHSTT